MRGARTPAPLGVCMSRDRIWHDRSWADVWLRTRATDGDAPTPVAATERCYAEHGERIFRTLLRTYVRATTADIEDAVQYAFLKYFHELSSDKTVDDPARWLLTTAKNHLLNRFRRQSTWELPNVCVPLAEVTETLTDGITVDDHLTGAIQQARFEAARQTLPPFEGRCFAARLANKKLKEIAEEEGVDLRRVAEAVHRAAAHIKRYLREDGR